MENLATVGCDIAQNLKTRSWIVNNTTTGFGRFWYECKYKYGPAQLWCPADDIGGH